MDAAQTADPSVDRRLLFNEFVLADSAAFRSSSLTSKTTNSWTGSCFHTITKYWTGTSLWWLNLHYDNSKLMSRLIEPHICQMCCGHVIFPVFQVNEDCLSALLKSRQFLEEALRRTKPHWRVNDVLDSRGSSLWPETPPLRATSAVRMPAVTRRMRMKAGEEEDLHGSGGSWGERCPGRERTGAITESLLTLWEKVLRPWRPTEPPPSCASACRTVPGACGRVWFRADGGRRACPRTAAGVCVHVSVCVLAETRGGMSMGKWAAGSRPGTGGAGAGTGGGGWGMGTGESL